MGRPPPSPPSAEVHRTGDLFRRSTGADGRVWYVCRADDVIARTPLHGGMYERVRARTM